MINEPTPREGRRNPGRLIRFDQTLKKDLIACLEGAGITQAEFTKRMRPDENGLRFGSNLISKIINGVYDNNRIGVNTESELRYTIAKINAEKDKPSNPVFPIHANGNASHLYQQKQPTTESTVDELQELALDCLLRLSPAQLKKAVSLLGVIEKADL